MNLSVKKFLLMKSRRMPDSKISPGRPMPHSPQGHPWKRGLEKWIIASTGYAATPDTSFMPKI